MIITKKTNIYAFLLFLGMLSGSLVSRDKKEINTDDRLSDETTNNFSYYKERRSQLIERIKAVYPDVKNGVIVLFGNFEPDVREFEQERHFDYLTGVKEPGTALLLDLSSGESTLYIPGDMEKRVIWAIVQPVFLEKDPATMLGIDRIVKLESDDERAFEGPFFKDFDYLDLRKRLSEVVQNGGKVFTLNPTINRLVSIQQRAMVDRFCKYVPSLQEHIEDITSILFRMRHVKEEREIACLRKAVAITIEAQKAAAQAIKAGKKECEIRAVIDGTMFAKSRPGFYSIIPSGKNSIILHKFPDDTVMNDGDLVIVDVGAECPCHGYSADLTRTYPVSGKFTDEQREIYIIVLAAQQYIIKYAKPGYCFWDESNPEKSLFHIMRKFFEQYGYGEYFPHGVGHHIGLNAHEDCYQNPDTWKSDTLQVGNVIALEPGLYIPEKGFGIRIESNCIVTENGAVCLDDTLPKEPEEIEKLVQKQPE